MIMMIMIMTMTMIMIMTMTKGKDINRSINQYDPILFIIYIYQYESIISSIAAKYSNMTIVQLNDQVNQKLAELQKQVTASKKTTDLVKYLEDSKNTIVGSHCPYDS